MKKILFISALTILSSFSAFADCDPKNYTKEIETAFKDQLPRFFIKAAGLSDNNKFYTDEQNSARNPKNWLLGKVTVNKNNSSISLDQTWLRSSIPGIVLVKGGKSKDFGGHSVPGKKSYDVQINGHDIKFNYMRASIVIPTTSLCAFYYLLDETTARGEVRPPNNALYFVDSQSGWIYFGTNDNLNKSNYLVLSVPNKDNSELADTTSDLKFY